MRRFHPHPRGAACRRTHSRYRHRGPRAPRRRSAVLQHARYIRDRPLGRRPVLETQATTGVPNLIADMNWQDLAFTVHDGDLKRATTRTAPTLCTPMRWDISTRSSPGRLHARATTTGPTATARAGFNSLERLDHERQLFFSTPYSLGQHRLRQEVQTDAEVPRCERAATRVRREPPLDDRRRDLRHPERPGIVQQPLRRAGPTPANTRRAIPPTSPGCRRRSRRRKTPFRRRHAHLSGRSWLRRLTVATRAPAARPDDARRPPATRRLPGVPHRAARRGHRLQEAGRIRPRRLALLPYRQALPERAGPAARELHARRDFRRPRRTATTMSTG